MGRPATKSVNLKAGYYIELRNKGANTGIKIRRDTYEEIQVAIDKYRPTHEVHYIGKVENRKKKKSEETSDE